MLPELSIIIPVLNEAVALPPLFAMLARQQGVRFEAVLCDGGSSDGTAALADALSAASPFPCTVRRSRRGRGRQLNAGAAVARGEIFLFLHADSRFADPLALSRGLATLGERIGQRGDGQVAGRFALRFDRAGRPSFPYRFHETKARLDRAGCIHGDQGFLLPRDFFFALGAFEEELGYLEDDRLADSVRRQGEWILLPAEVHTSARRFESEGLRQRQTLNALLLNFAAIGWEEILEHLPGIYRQHDRTKRLDLHPYFREIRRRLDRLPLRQRFTLWYRTGAFVRDNAWQVPFAWQAWRHFRQARPPGPESTRWLERFDRSFNLLTDHPPARLAVAALVWIWFHCHLLASPGRKGKGE